ncbi:MAG: hypothetical protein PVI23_13825 [Maricaulaceae bacterium]|jgi:hypothetical protein
MIRPRSLLKARHLLQLARAGAFVAAALGASAFAARQPVEENVVRPLAREFELAVVEGALAPANAYFTRQADTYVNRAPTATGANFMDASWFTVHRVDGGALLFAYASTDATGTPISRLSYVREYEHNRFRVYRFDFGRFEAAMEALESKVRRGNANRRERRQFERLTELWNAHELAESISPTGEMHIRDLDDVNELIDFSGRLEPGQRIIVSTGDVLELYIR